MILISYKLYDMSHIISSGRGQGVFDEKHVRLNCRVIVNVGLSLKLDTCMVDFLPVSLNFLGNLFRIKFGNMTPKDRITEITRIESYIMTHITLRF